MEDATEKKERKFKVGDRVHFISRDYGTIIKISQSKTEKYPIEVKWDKTNAVSTFTKDGYIWNCHTDNAPQLTVVDKAAKFKEGDHVWSFNLGVGVVQNIYKGDNIPYPVEVKWTEDAKYPNTQSYFTKDGMYDKDDNDPKLNIMPLEGIDLYKKDDEDVVNQIMDALNKNIDDAITPSHYKVKGLPEAHEIMHHLMHREQLEGFYWGNIIKYAYRYGRKGDKAETAGKIVWYAKKLKELGECESK